MTINLATNLIVCDNSKELSQDAIFIITKQNQKYVEDAKKSGCTRFITPKELSTLLNFNAIKIVGITGTNGKTTTSAAIYSSLLDLGFRCALLGTRGFFINGNRKKEKGLTTPSLLELYANIKEAIDNKCDYFVMEVSSHAIDQQRIEGLDFAIKVHTNITSDHLDYHKTLEHYIATKNSFFADETLKVVNKDDPNIKFNPKNSYTYAIESLAAMSVKAYSLKDSIDASISFLGEDAYLHSSLFGRFNLYNLLAAISTTKLLTNKKLQEICEAIEHFGGVSGRIEVVSKEPLVIIDFAHTHDGMQKVLETFIGKDISVVFGAGGNRDRTKRPKMGKVAELFANRIYITNDNPRSEDPKAIADEILSGIENKEKVKTILDRKEAIKVALQELPKNGVLLILGKGDEEYQIIGDKKYHFSDKEVVLELLGGKNEI